MMETQEEEKQIASAEGSAVEEAEITVASPGLPLVVRLSSVLFVSPRPLTVQKLADVTGADVEEVEQALSEVAALYSDELNGFSLHEVAGAWQLRTSPEAGRFIQKIIPARARRLSRAALETLAVIAYKQPVPRAEIESIRGVDVLPTLKTLLDAKFVRIVGRDDSPGQPSLYGTTETFLEKFGLKDLSELPTVREIEQLMGDPGEADFEAEDSEESEPSLEFPEDLQTQ